MFNSNAFRVELSINNISELLYLFINDKFVLFINILNCKPRLILHSFKYFNNKVDENCN